MFLFIQINSRIDGDLIKLQETLWDNMMKVVLQRTAMLKVLDEPMGKLNKWTGEQESDPKKVAKILHMV
jgi:hypothetical protein